MRLGEFLGEIGNAVAFYPSVSRAVRGVTPGIFLCQLCYWHGKQHDHDGWIRKAWGDVEKETGLNRDEQRKARAILRGLGVISERQRGTPYTTEYRINFDRLAELWTEFSRSDFPSSWEPLPNQLGTIPQLDGNHSPTLLERENTTENTQRERGAARRRPRAPLPDDFDLTPKRAAVATMNGCRDPARSFAQFRDYHIAAGTLSADWDASWRTWCGRHNDLGCPCMPPRSRPGETAPMKRPAVPPPIAKTMTADEQEAWRRKMFPEKYANG